MRFPVHPKLPLLHTSTILFFLCLLQVYEGLHKGPGEKIGRQNWL